MYCDVCRIYMRKKKKVDCLTYVPRARMWDKVPPPSIMDKGALVECLPSERALFTSAEKVKLGDDPRNVEELDEGCKDARQHLDECPCKKRQLAYQGIADTARKFCRQANERLSRSMWRDPVACQTLINQPGIKHSEDVPCNLAMRNFYPA